MEKVKKGSEDAKIDKKERDENERNGRGRLTNAEVKKEQAENEQAGRGKLTNAELVASATAVSFSAASPGAYGLGGCLFAIYQWGLRLEFAVIV